MTTGRSRATRPAPSAGSPASPTCCRRSACELERLVAGRRPRRGARAVAALAPLSRLDMDPRLVQSFKAALDLTGALRRSHAPAPPAPRREAAWPVCALLSSPYDRRRRSFELEPERRPGRRGSGPRARGAGRLGRARRARARREARRCGRPRRRRRRRSSDLIVSDVGKPITEARAEVARAAAILRYAASLATGPAGELYEDATGATVRVLRFPRGVALLIMPVELPHRDPDVEDRARAAGRQRGRAQAGLAGRCAIAERLVEHLDLGDVVQLVRGRRATVAERAARRAPGRRLLHRLDRDRPLDRRAPRGRLRPAAARDGRQERRLRVRGRRPGAGGAGSPSAARWATRARSAPRPRCCSSTSAALDAVVAGAARAGRRARRRRPGRPGTVVGPMIDAAKRDEVAEQIAGAELLAGGEAERPRACSPPPCSPASTRPTTRSCSRPCCPSSPSPDMDAALERLHALEYGLVAGIVSPLRDEVEAFARGAEAGIVRVNAPTAGRRAARPVRRRQGVELRPARAGPRRPRVLLGDPHDLRVSAVGSTPSTRTRRGCRRASSRTASGCCRARRCSSASARRDVPRRPAHAADARAARPRRDVRRASCSRRSVPTPTGASCSSRCPAACRCAVTARSASRRCSSRPAWSRSPSPRRSCASTCPPASSRRACAVARRPGDGGHDPQRPVVLRRRLRRLRPRLRRQLLRDRRRGGARAHRRARSTRGR